jgi:hypothetical protein
MNYTKPEVAVLGDAAQVIQRLGKTGPVQLDFGQKQVIEPAYDLDE